MITYYYSKTLESITSALLERFTHLQVNRYSKDRATIVKTIDVPIAFAPVEKTQQDRLENYSAEPESTGQRYYLQVPRLALVFNGFAYAPDRATGVNEYRYFQGQDSQHLNAVFKDIQPSPWNFTYTLFIRTDSISDFSQIIENVLPYFNPKLYLRVKEFSFLNIERDLAVILNDATPEFTDELDKNSMRQINGSITFSVEGWMYKPVDAAKLVKVIRTRYFVDGEAVNDTLMDENGITRTPANATVFVDGPLILRMTVIQPARAYGQINSVYIEVSRINSFIPAVTVFTSNGVIRVSTAQISGTIPEATEIGYGNVNPDTIQLNGTIPDTTETGYGNIYPDTTQLYSTAPDPVVAAAANADTFPALSNNTIPETTEIGYANIYPSSAQLPSIIQESNVSAEANTYPDTTQISSALPSIRIKIGDVRFSWEEVIIPVCARPSAAQLRSIINIVIFPAKYNSTLPAVTVRAKATAIISSAAQRNSTIKIPIIIPHLGDVRFSWEEVIIPVAVKPTVVQLPSIIRAATETGYGNIYPSTKQLISSARTVTAKIKAKAIISSAAQASSTALTPTVVTHLGDIRFSLEVD